MSLRIDPKQAVVCCLVQIDEPAGPAQLGSGQESRRAIPSPDFFKVFLAKFVFG